MGWGWGWGWDLRIALNYLLLARFNADNQGYADEQVLNTTGEGIDTGQLTVIENDGTAALASNKFAFTAQSTPGWGDLGFYSGAVTRSLGQTLLGTFNLNDTTHFVPMLIWLDNGGIALADVVCQMYARNDAGIYCQTYDGAGNNTSSVLVAAYAGSTAYTGAIVLGGYDSNGVPWKSGDAAASYLYGASFFIKGGAYTAWNLIWRTALMNTSTQYAGLSNYDATGTMDNFMVPDIDLSAVLQPAAFSTFTDDNSTSLDAITPEVGGAWTEQSGAWDIQSNRPNPDGAAIATVDPSVADVVLTCIVNGAADDNPAVVLRFSDTSNYWYLQADRANNNLELHEYNATVDTIRAQDTSATINDSTDYTLVAIADGQDITGFLNAGDRINYGSAALNEAATVHGIRAEHTDGRFDNFYVNSRTATAYNALDNV